ncbi:hypothetical protein ABC382_00420 [Lysinibacillus sp. 1P01SD]|uniref:hypothetical protein n=1 Tax=Lysinibacillus sp. 1P01SD TaxID=3132285 RepID=UPI0039A3A92F
MNRKTKDKVYYGLTILVFLVLLIAIFTGKNTNNKDRNEEVAVEENKDKTDVIRNPASPLDKDDESNGKGDNSSNLDLEEPNIEHPTNPSSNDKQTQSQSEQVDQKHLKELAELEKMSEEVKKVYGNLDREKLFSKSELKHSGKITADFLGKFLTYDKDNPDGKIREIIPYGDESVKLTLAKILSKESTEGANSLGEQEHEHEEAIFPIDIYKNDLKNVSKRTITDFKLQVPDAEQTPDFLDWEALIDMELEMEDGTKKAITETYVVSLQYFGKEMKVVYFGKKKQ